MTIKNIITVLTIFLSGFCYAGTSTKVDFNFDWKFSKPAGFVPQDTLFLSPDIKWEDVCLPHDWSISEGYTKTQTAGSNGFLPGGVGIYMKNFLTSDDMNGKKVFIHFEGVYNNSKVWINGHMLGFRPNGYVGFEYELTQYLKPKGSMNTITVCVDRRAYADSRWYVGAGIYRNVSLILRNELYIPSDGIFVTTPQVGNRSMVNVVCEVKNAGTGVKGVTVKHEVVYDGKTIASVSDDFVALKGDFNEFTASVELENCHLWSLETPSMYELHTTLIASDGYVMDKKTTKFGIRDIKFDADEGFLLNGKSVKIKGVNIHHDLGCMGVAAYDDALLRRLMKLRSIGCNAIRTAHNPHSESLLEMCDSLGLLVMNEFIDEWKVAKKKWITERAKEDAPDSISIGYTRYFDTHAEHDLKSFIRRDRNHPCVILWSIGNEIEWTYPYYWASSKDNKGFKGLIHTGDPETDNKSILKEFNRLSGGKDDLAETAAVLAGWVKDVDTTRPVSSGVVVPSVSRLSGYTDVLDVVGYNYKDKYYEIDHKLYPYQPIIGSENVGQLFEWTAVADKKYIAGIFVWTGFDYLGENGPWPARGGDCSFFDFVGNKTARGHFFECLWKDTPKTHIVTIPEKESEFKMDADGSFTYTPRPGWIRRWEWYDTRDKWKYRRDEDILVQVYTNAPEVELFLNGKSLGTKKRSDFMEHNILMWKVAYKEGTLLAVGKDGDRILSKDTLSTSGKPCRLALNCDRKTATDNGYDLIHVEVSIEDKEGNTVVDIPSDVRIILDDKLELAGLDNGSPSIEDLNINVINNSVRTYNGKCLFVLRTIRGKKGTSFVKVVGDGGIQGRCKILISHPISH